MKSKLKFEWDEEKNMLNKKNHRISFEDATAVFEDPQVVTIYDEAHSEDEDRFIVIGFDFLSRHLAVCHCLRESGDIVRIISARMATKDERKFYREENNIYYED